MTDEKITLTDAEMQKIEDSLVQKQKDFEEKSTALDAAEKKVKDLEAQKESINCLTFPISDKPGDLREICPR